MTQPAQTLAEASAALDAGATTSRKLVEACLERIAAADGEDGRAFVRVYAAEARAMADACDLLRHARRHPGPLAGIPISIKDLFDVAGETTPAGSLVCADAAPATSHAPVVARVLAAGLIPVGRTNMTEFAFSGLGMNPHHGTPRSPWDRATGRIAGGSSSGAAVSVTDGMALGALGTDTGGSCRIPAAFCGIVGYKPTARRVPLDGVLPLAPSLDSVGPLANSVACCATLDAVLAGAAPQPVVPRPVGRLRLAVPQGVMLDGLDDVVAATFERALTRLAAAGAEIVPTRFAALAAAHAMPNRGAIAAAEAFAWHRALLAARGPRYDPQVRSRILRGEGIGVADYRALLASRATLIAALDRETAAFDAMVLPTCPVVPPKLTDLAASSDYARINALVLRNPSDANFFDRCAISLPCHRPGHAPVGLMLVGETMGDARLFAVAAAIERLLRQ